MNHSNLQRIRQLTQELGDDEFDLHLFFKFSIDAFVVLEQTGVIRRINPAFSQLLGWSSPEMIERSYVGLVHVGDVRLANIALQILNVDDLVGFQNRCLTKNGQYLWLEWSATKWRHGRSYATARPISDRQAVNHATSG